jgi:leucyl aminopeptidase (aminopeptidase T)
MKRRAAWLKAALDQAGQVRITAPGGTDVSFSILGRKAKLDDGDFSVSGTGGNLPAGEAFISPALSSATGVIAFDGSISTAKGTLLIRHPIRTYLEGGFITKIEGGKEADILRKTLEDSACKAFEMEKSGTLRNGQAEVYAKNAYGIGELGIGINEKAKITGNMLEDEKAFRTCHLAIGANYDEDAPALNHLDGLVRKPTIVLTRDDKIQKAILVDGVLQED